MTIWLKIFGGVLYLYSYQPEAAFGTATATPCDCPYNMPAPFPSIGDTAFVNGQDGVFCVKITELKP